MPDFAELLWFAIADQWTRSECAVAVKIGKRWGAAMRSFPSVVIVTLCGLLDFADVEAVEGVGESGPLHERRRLRRPDVLEVVDPAIGITKYEVQVACEDTKRAVAVYRSADAG